MSYSQHEIDLLIKKLKKKKEVANIKHDPVVHCTKCLRPKIAMGCEMKKINGMMLKEDFVKILELVKTCGSVTSRKRLQFLVYILQQKGLGFKERFKYHPYPSSNSHETGAGKNYKEE